DRRPSATPGASRQPHVAPRALRRAAQGSRQDSGIRARPPPQRERQLMSNTIRITTLPNGLRVATDRMDSVETVSLGVWAGVGTHHETKEHNGVAHLLEHMAFKGTKRRSARDI